jgi:hypothetical protein
MVAFDADRELGRRRRIRWALIAAVIVVLALLAWQFVSLHNQVHNLKKEQSVLSAQVSDLQSKLRTVDSSLNAAVACLQTPQGLQGLCSKLVH